MLRLKTVNENTSIIRTRYNLRKYHAAARAISPTGQGSLTAQYGEPLNRQAKPRRGSSLYPRFPLEYLTFLQSPFTFLVSLRPSNPEYLPLLPLPLPLLYFLPLEYLPLLYLILGFLPFPDFPFFELTVRGEPV